MIASLLRAQEFRPNAATAAAAVAADLQHRLRTCFNGGKIRASADLATWQ